MLSVPFECWFLQNIILSSPPTFRMDDHFRNPFTESNVSIPTSSSLLTYGDDSISFFSRLSNSRRLFRSQTVYLTQKQVEQNIVSRLHKEMYTMDESGHCLAETAIDQMITEDSEKQLDFWQQIRVLKREKQIQNPFSSTMENTPYPKTTALNQKYTVSRLHRSQVVGPPKTHRHLARLEMAKMKDIIKKQKLKQEEKQGKAERFSLINMYKIKRQKKPSPIPADIVPELKTETPRMPPQYPASITLRNTLYLRVELQS